MEPMDDPQKYFERSLEDFFHPLFAQSLPDDRMYSKGHMWIKNDSASTTTVGIDHIGAYFLRPVVSVVLPQVPSRVEFNLPCAWLSLREGTIALRSALSGIGIESNTKLLEHPYLLLDDPYSSGWMLRVTQEGKPGDDLFDSREFNPIFQSDMSTVKDKFITAFRKLQLQTVPTMYDGGEPVKTVDEILGQKKYFEIVSRLFSKS